jgi:hypothetical protein
MKAALEGYKFVPPQIEYHDRMTINFGGKTIELMFMKGVHSESDNAVWLPKEPGVFSASAYVANQINILRPFVTIPDILAADKILGALNPEHVDPGHGRPGVLQISDDGDKYYALLTQRVDALMKQGRSLDDIKKEIKMPEYASWATQDRMPTNFRPEISSRFHAGNRSACRARIPHRPPATIDKGQKIANDPIELVRRFEIDRVAATRHDGESGGGNGSFQQNARQQAGPVFIPGQNKRRHRQALHVFDEIIERGAFALDAKLRIRRAQSRMLRQHSLELSVPARVLVLELHTSRPIRVFICKRRHTG